GARLADGARARRTNHDVIAMADVHQPEPGSTVKRKRSLVAAMHVQADCHLRKAPEQMLEQTPAHASPPKVGPRCQPRQVDAALGYRWDLARELVQVRLHGGTRGRRHGSQEGEQAREPGTLQ